MKTEAGSRGRSTADSPRSDRLLPAGSIDDRRSAVAAFERWQHEQVANVPPESRLRRLSSLLKARLTRPD